MLDTKTTGTICHNIHLSFTHVITAMVNTLLPLVSQSVTLSVCLSIMAL